MNDIVSQKNDEIDLIELIKVLWAKKVWIVLSAFICTAIAGVYAFTAKEEWTSKAELIEPKSGDIEEYTNLRKEYTRITQKSPDTLQDLNAINVDNEQVDNEVQIAQKIKNYTPVVEKRLFYYFIQAAESFDIKKDFFIQSSYYRNLTEEKTELNKQNNLSSMISSISIIKPDLKKNINDTTIKFRFSDSEPKNAKNNLDDFIKFVNNIVITRELDDFSKKINEAILDLKYEKSKIESDLIMQKNIQLSKLEVALDIASRVSLKDYAENNNPAIEAIAISESKYPYTESLLSYNTFLFMLGEKYLKAQIDVLKQNDVIYPPRYYEVSTLLSQLEPLLTKVKEVKANAFSYQASPDYPVVKDKPKKALILAIGFIIGLILSSFVILLRSIILITSNKG